MSFIGLFIPFSEHCGPKLAGDLRFFLDTTLIVILTFGEHDN